MIDEAEPGESEIRKRAAWLLGMLALVAALLVVVMVTFLGSSNGQTNDRNGLGVDDPTPTGTSVPAPHGRSGAPGTATSGPVRTLPSGGSSSGSTSGAASTGPAPKASCPGQDICTVTGDIAAATSAINAYRAENGEKAVPASTSPGADKCALSSGSDCPSSFVWVHVKDLSGKAVVDGVTRFGSTDDLLDKGAKSFEIGWAYDPSSHSSSCAVIRND